MKDQIRATSLAARLPVRRRTAGAKHVLRLRDGWAKGLAMVLVVIAVSCAVAIAAIDRGNIQGTVADEQNAVIPGAKVVVKNLDTNIEVALTTNNSGAFSGITWYDTVTLGRMLNPSFDGKAMSSNSTRCLLMSTGAITSTCGLR